ncbi:hypothetical protein DV872_21830 [Oceanispirochaeta sp. M1]|nr:hypothetical protein DV872_21830 [Oceanispirochaeta sp. M1]
MKFKNIKQSYLSELEKETFRTVITNLKPLKATINEIDELFNFQKSIDEFDLSDDARDSFGNEIITNTGKVYYIRVNV